MLSLEHFSNKTSQKLGLGKGDKNICLSIAVTLPSTVSHLCVLLHAK